jgi:hypothetical protein
MKIATALCEELFRIIGALVIESPRSFTFAGRPSSGLSMPLPGLRLAPEMPPVLSELVGQLYQHCYTNRFSGTLNQPELPGQALDTEWLEQLSGANQSKARFEDGWHMQFGMPNGQVIAQRGALTRMLAPGEFVDLGGSGMALAPGAVLRLYIPSESRALQPGYYSSFGETLCDSLGETSVVRFYWNVPFESAANLLQFISGELNRWEVPFRFKVAGVRTMFERSDSAVLYIPRRYAQLAIELVWEIYQQIGRSLRCNVPLFTLRLAPGLAFAEDPGTQESFGMSRCRLVAQGLWLSHLRGVHHADDQLQVIDEQFTSECISLERPWLNTGSVDEFAFPVSCD